MSSKSFEEFIREVEGYINGDLLEALEFLEQTELMSDSHVDDMRIRSHRKTSSEQTDTLKNL
jgi:hypothetical protein